RRHQRFLPRRHQRSPDRTKSIARRRRLGGSHHLPPQIREHFTQGWQAVLTNLALDHIAKGFSDDCHDARAAKSGVSRTTARDAIQLAQILGLISVEERPVPGRKSRTNIIRIVSREWLTWLARGPAGSRVGAGQVSGFVLHARPGRNSSPT